ncbi:MAG: conjugal transfer protein TraH [Sulfuricellaceae bacterium]
MVIKRIVLVLLAVALAVNPVGAITMKEIFDGANTNVTPGGAYSGQTMNYYTGGSMFMRVPSKNYQLASVTPPSFKMNSCGALDAYIGGISHISSQEFVNMLKQIGTGAVAGFAFKLAMSAMSPDIQNIMQQLNDAAQKINKLNVDSCEVATGIIKASDDISQAKGELTLGAMSDAFKGVAPDFGAALDAIKNIGKNTPVAAHAAAAASGLDEKIADGNITWQAINKMPDSFFPQDARNYKYLLMSLIGPHIFSPKTHDDDPKIAIGDVAYTTESRPPIKYSIAELIGTPSATNKIKLSLYTCDEQNKCKNPIFLDASLPSEGVEFDSFLSMVDVRMNSIKNNMLNASKPSDAQDIAFVNSTSIPIYKMLSVATQMRNSVVADYMINKYKEAIAAEYATAFISTALKEVRDALGNAGGKSQSPVKKEALEKLAARATEIRKEYAADMVNVYAKLQAVNSITAEIVNLERAMSASLPADLQSNLQFQLSQGG